MERPSIIDWTGNPLHVCALCADVRQAAPLLRAGADPNVSLRECGTPLHVAARESRHGYQDADFPGFARLLLVHGARLDVVRTRGGTPLHDAAEFGCDDVAGVLIEAGADVNSRDHIQGCSPLHLAAAAGHDQTVRMLLDRGARVDQVAQRDTSVAWSLRMDRVGTTPLQLAAWEGRVDIVKILLEAGADEGRVVVQASAGSPEILGRDALAFAHAHMRRSARGLDKAEQTIRAIEHRKQTRQMAEEVAKRDEDEIRRLRERAIRAADTSPAACLAFLAARLREHPEREIRFVDLPLPASLTAIIEANARVHAWPAETVGLVLMFAVARVIQAEYPLVGVLNDRVRSYGNSQFGYQLLKFLQQALAQSSPTEWRFDASGLIPPKGRAVERWPWPTAS